ncbi:MAG: adenylate/guanylate cyclase domain-containing protein [Caldilineaceae bacterium]
MSPAVNLAAQLGLVTSPSPKPKDKGGEQREVTVLFLDIVNFTGVSHRLDSEDVFQFINEAMKLFVGVLQKYSGVVDKFTGDGLMALFGAPVAHENDPELAIRSALEMLDVIAPLQKRLQESYNFQLQARIGIHTGLAIAGRLGGRQHQEYTVIGDTVNLASRLESASQPSTILVSGETFRRTRAHFHFTPIPDLRLKGISEPVTGYRPLRLRRRPGRVRGLAEFDTPMIGRGDELSQLNKTFTAMKESCQGHVLLITGEAGLGKSRLIQEFRRQLYEQNARSYLGTNYPHTRSIPYAAMARLLQDMLQIAENDPAEVQYKTLLEQLRNRAETDIHGLPYLLNVLGLDRFNPAARDQARQLDPQMLQRQTFVAVRRLLANEVYEKPVVLIIDDLHWIDAASQEMLLYLLRSTSDLPILFVVISRPVDQKSPAHGLLEEINKDKSRITTVQLQALSTERTRDLLGHFIQSEDEQSKHVIAEISTRAEGVPYYLEELVRMLMDKKALVEDEEGRYRATDQANSLLSEVPGTLAGLLMARFDSLEEQSRQILQNAVVLGRSFPVPLLQELCQIPVPALNAILSDLESRLFLRAEDFGSQPGYVFGHTLIRSTIHNTLLRRTRRQMHGQVAGVIERGEFFGEDARIDALGYHYIESDTPGKAIPYLLISAENAAVRGAHKIALDSYCRCLALPADTKSCDPDEYWRIRLGMGRTLKFLGELGEADQRLTEAVERLEERDSHTEKSFAILIQSLTELGDAHLRVGKPDSAWASLERARLLLEESILLTEVELSKLWTALLDRMAWARLRQGDLNEAIALAQEALDRPETNHSAAPSLLASLYNILGGVYYQKGISARAIQYVRMSLNLYEDLDYSWGVASALSNLGVLYYMQGLWSEAAEYYEQAEIIRREHGFAAERALNLYNLALLRAAMGDHQRSAKSFETSLRIGKQLGDHKVIGCCYIGLGQLADVEERVDDLHKYVDAADEYVAAFGDDHKTHLRLLQARLANHTGNFESAIRIAMSALGLAETAGLSEETVDAHRVLGTLYRSGGAFAESEKSLRYSLKLSQERNDPHHQGLAEIELARLFLDTQSADPASWKKNRVVGQAMLQSAIDHFEQVGAAYFLGLAHRMLRDADSEPVTNGHTGQ